MANGAWLALVLLGTGIAGLYGQLPGVEPAPYILRFDEDRPNPLYRKVCYTFAWNAALNFALLNLTGLVIAVITGVWTMKQLYQYVYFPLCILILLLGAFGKLPRVGKSTKDEGIERRYFYGSVWAVTISQTVLLTSVEDAPSHAHRQPRQARHLRRHAVRNGRGCVQRRASANPSHPARRIDGGLTACIPYRTVSFRPKVAPATAAEKPDVAFFYSDAVTSASATKSSPSTRQSHATSLQLPCTPTRPPSSSP